VIVYKTTNLINGKWYIGRDSKNNPNYLGSGTVFKRAVKKYGKENFKKEILDYADDIEDLKNKETYWIKKTEAATSTDSYNIKSSGQDGISSEEWAEEMLLKARNAALNLSIKDRKDRVAKTIKWWTKDRKRKQSVLKKEYYKNPHNIEKTRKAKLKSIKNDPSQVERQRQSL